MTKMGHNIHTNRDRNLGRDICVCVVQDVMGFVLGDRFCWEVFGGISQQNRFVVQLFMCATVGAETNKNKKQENKEPNKQHKMKNTNRKNKRLNIKWSNERV